MSLDLESLNPATALQPLGHYSQAVRAGDLLFLSGQVAVCADGVSLADAPLGRQFQQAMDNLKAIIEGAGSSLERVAKITIFLADPEGWPVVNEIYQGYFPKHRPARAVVPVSAFYGGFLVEVEAVVAL